MAFYITTPIYYVNDEPHLGHAWATLLADVLARYHRLRGEDGVFLTGVDEHGQKVYAAVKREQIDDPYAYVDQMARRFQSAWADLGIAYDDFIRTTEPRHVRVVQHALQDLYDRGEIYRGDYEGWYCVPDERFWTEKDLKEGACPDCGRPVERIVEANYFFRMGKYQEWLVATLNEHPAFIQPEYRRSEVLGFLRQPLGDLCISRPASRLNWGIPLPFDPGYVTYVWFDALLNYVTAAGWRADEAKFNRLWPHAVHLIGKDILTTHSVYWLTMLKAMGLPLPKQIFAHGWWMSEGKKMSKSLGNVVRPSILAQEYGVDVIRYFLMREMTPGLDDDFREQRLVETCAADLSNNLGNLLHRVTNMTARYFGGVLPAPAEEGAEEQALRAVAEQLPAVVYERVDAFQVNAAIEAIMSCLSAANGYLERAAPWKEAKAGRLDHTGTTLYTAAQVLEVCARLLAPVVPQKSTEALGRLGADPLEGGAFHWHWGALPPGAIVTQGEPLFPRIEMKEKSS